jgi:hypothetical protein
MRLSEVAEKVISLKEAANRHWAVELPKRHPDYPSIDPFEDSGPPSAEEEQLVELIGKLPADKVYQLLLLMYLGRGDFEARNLARIYQELKRQFAEPEWAAAQILEKSPLVDYLTRGMDKLQRQNIDLDNLPVRLAGSVR